MKRRLLILAITATLLPWAQSEPVQPPKAQHPYVLPWWFTNPPSLHQSTPNPAVLELGSCLGTLQNDMQQTLPLLAPFNATLPSPNPAPAEAPAPAPAPNPAPTGVNSGTNYGQNFSSRSGANYGQNVSTPVGYTPPSPALSSGFSVVVPPRSSEAVDPFSTPPVPPATVQNEIVTPDSTAEAIHELLALQADIQRLLPLVASLNSGGFNLASGTAPESVPNNFSAPTNRLYVSPTGNQSPPLTPTGR